MDVATPGLATGMAARKLGNQGLKVSKPIRTATEHDDGDVEDQKILLEREIAIDRDKHLKLFRGQRKEFSILYR
jgi:hypothetical protein